MRQPVTCGYLELTCQALIMQHWVTAYLQHCRPEGKGGRCQGNRRPGQPSLNGRGLGGRACKRRAAAGAAGQAGLLAHRLGRPGRRVCRAFLPLTQGRARLRVPVWRESAAARCSRRWPLGSWRWQRRRPTGSRPRGRRSRA